jgi:hypothetical protein
MKEGQMHECWKKNDIFGSYVSALCFFAAILRLSDECG